MDITDTDLVEVARFVRLVENLTVEALNQVDIERLPVRDRQYVQRLRILAAEDTNLVQRQRVVWLKLRQAIPLLESEARELLEVLGCRGFYFSGLNLDGMVFSKLDLSGGMVVGDYSCQFTHVRGWCNEQGLIVVGRYLSHSRRLDGGLAAEGLRVLGHTASSQTPASRESLGMPAVSHLGGNGSIASASKEDSAAIVELSEDDIINSYLPPPVPPNRHRSGRPLIPPPPSSVTSVSRRSLAPRTGSSRCSRPPRASVSPRFSVPFSMPPTNHPPQGETVPDTRDIDVAWE